jgi:membrane protease YdiL (CAAX protease family)
MRTRRGLVTIMLPVVLAASWVALGSVPSDGDWGSYWVGLRVAVFLAFFTVAVASSSRLGMSSRLGLGKSRLSWAALLMLALGTLSLSYGLDGVYQMVPHADSTPAVLERELAGARGAEIVLALLCFALAPGIAEELLCRGLVQRGLETRRGPAVAILGAALLFGVLHADPVYSILTALIGAYFGVVAYLAGSVRASIVCHATNNAVAVLWAASETDSAAAGPIAIALSTAFSLLVLVGLWRRLKPDLDASGPRASREPGLQPQAGSDDS